jgi:hypothetical protein
MFWLRGSRVLKSRSGSRARVVLSVVVCACLVNVLTGCSAWKPVELPNYRLLRDGEKMGHVLVTLQNGRHFELWSTRAYADSVVGYTADIQKHSTFRPRPEFPDVVPTAESYRTSIAIADIKNFDVRKFSAGKTIGLAGGVLAGAVAAGVAALAIAISDMEPVVLFPY